MIITADWYDDVGEFILNQTGIDVRDPCGDRSIDDTDLFIVSDACGQTSGVPNCAMNDYTFVAGVDNARGGTLAANAGLDGGVWTFYAVSATPTSSAVTGVSWTS